ncbi:MAG TPA: lipopolysaccharide assembly protein LapB [Gammaproteobacteria bacterium]
MPTNDLLLLAGLLLVALLVGWLTGRHSRDQRAKDGGGLPGEYFRGLNFLLNEEPDKALEVFIRMVEVDSDTLETHFALGSLFRRRGEVDRAIRIHQNLIARPNLSRRHRTQALFELGEDYLKAGLLDRAENLFSELAREKAHVEAALGNLLMIFEQQKDWEKAIGAARQLESVSGRYRNREIAHYYCELAERELDDRNWRAANRHLRRANAFDRDAVRVALLNARLAEGEGDDKRALRHYRRALAIDPAKAGMILPALVRLHAQTGRPGDFDDAVRQLVREQPESMASVAVAALRDPSIRGAAVDECIERYLESEPGLPGLGVLQRQIEDLRRADAPLTARHIAKLLLGQAQGEGYRYRCAECGYHGKTLYWQCPSCRQWDRFRPEFDLVLISRESRTHHA